MPAATAAPGPLGDAELEVEPVILADSIARYLASANGHLAGARGGWRSPGASEDGDEETEPRVSAVNPMGLPLRELKRLKDRFQDASGQPVKLTMDQFVQALSSNQPHGETKAQRERFHAELQTLFKKIDASCGDMVNWEQFTEYMLLHMPGLSVGEGPPEPQTGPQGADAIQGAPWGTGHSDMISSITIVNDIGGGGASSRGPGNGAAAGGAQRRYVTAGRDGVVKVWHPNLTVHRAIDVGSSRCWLAACVWMQKSRYLAVASSNFRIFFYDANFSQTQGPAGASAFIDHKDGTPLCLGYMQSNDLGDGGEKEILMVGDNNGYVTVYPMDDNWTERDSKSESEPLPFERQRPIRRQYHKDWVTKVGFVPELQAMVTCGLDGDINLCDVSANTRKVGCEAIRLHKKGVYSWCWCRSYKFFASGGLDRQIIIWNPYTQRAMNHLQGHNAPIVDIVINEKQHQLISMSVDKVVKIWDIRNYRCIQTFMDKTEYKPEDRLTCMSFDDEGSALVMCSSTLSVFPVSVKVETSRTHSTKIVAALYNETFWQIVSGDVSGTVCVWDTRTGTLEFEWKRAHGDHKLTCMSFDASKRRLYTGGEDGVIRLWNFSSGQHLRTYAMSGQPCEINGVLWAQTALGSPEGPNTFVVALAWDRRIYVWPESRKQTVEPQYVLEDSSGQGHTDDITCICGLSTVGGLLATGGDDGFVVFWKVQETSASSKSSTYRLRDDGSAGRGRGAGRGAGGGPEGQPPQPDARARGRGRGAAGPGFKGGVDYTGSTAQKVRGSLLPDIAARRPSHLAGDLSPGESPGPGPAPAPPASDAHAAQFKEIGFEDEESSMDGVECMIFLEHKDCILTSHADRTGRLWSRPLAEFLQRVDLGRPAETAPEPPPPREPAPDEAADGAAGSPEGAAPAQKAGSARHGVHRVNSRESRVGSHASAAAAAARPPSSGSLRAAAYRPKTPPAAAAITVLYSDPKENKWLFTGDAEGAVRIWDLQPLQPPAFLRRLEMLREFAPHKKAVTHIQRFELEGHAVVMTASDDGTVALCNTQGERIGTLGGAGPSGRWTLADRSTWKSAPPSLDEERAGGEEAGPRAGGARRAAKGAGAGRGRGSAVPSDAARSPRRRPLQTRPVAAQAPNGQGIFKKLQVDSVKPDLGVADGERALHLSWRRAQTHQRDPLP